jgi:hypothetical protein
MNDIVNVNKNKFVESHINKRATRKKNKAREKLRERERERGSNLLN